MDFDPWVNEAPVTHRPITQPAPRPASLRAYDQYVVDEMARVTKLRAARRRPHWWAALIVCAYIGGTICVVLGIIGVLMEAYGA